MTAFEGVLARLIQSNAQINEGSPLEFVIQVIRNPRGGGRQKQYKPLDNEIIDLKRPRLCVVENKNNNLCFAVNLAHLTHPHFTDNQALERSKELQRLAGLGDQTEVTLSDIGKFEQILNRKIVVYYRQSENRTLSLLETDFPNTSHPLYLFLFQNHYYGVKNLKALLGVRHVCHHCHRGYKSREKHACPNHCNLCLEPDCVTHYSDAVFCTDCNRSCRTHACFWKHKQPRPFSHSNLSICQQMYKCPDCKHLVSRHEEHKWLIDVESAEQSVLLTAT